MQLCLQELVYLGCEGLHSCRVVEVVDGLQLQPDEGFAGVIRTSLGHDLVSLEVPVEPLLGFAQQGGDIPNKLRHGIRYQVGGLQVGQESDERHFKFLTANSSSLLA